MRSGVVRLRARAGWLAAGVAALLVGTATVGCSPREVDAPEAWRDARHIGYDHAFDGADILVDREHAWIASVDSPAAAVPRIVVRREPWSTRDAIAAAGHVPATTVGACIGTSPSLVQLDDAIGMLYRSVIAKSGSALLFRRYDSGSGRWSRPTRVDAGHGNHSLGNGRLVRNTDGSLMVPVVCAARGGTTGGGKPMVELCVSADGGRSWRLAPTGLSDLALPALAPTLAGLVLVGHRNGTLVRSVSTDAGASWSPPIGLPILAMRSPHAVQRVGPGALLLVWTEPKPSQEHVQPAIQSLLCSWSNDLGQTWRAPLRLVTRPGIVPVAPALAPADERIELVFEQRQRRGAGQQRLSLDHDGLPGRDRPASRSLHVGVDADGGRRQLRESLCILTAHTLARPQRADELFIETYFMRSLVHAHTALAQLETENESWLDTQVGLRQAIAFADSQVAAQGRTGYWSIGYRAMFAADMATLVGLFRALEPHVDAERMRRYRQAVQSFVAGLQRDHMLQASGAVAGGYAALRSTELRRPFLVATALAGVEAHAWLFAQTRDERYRDTARSALRFILDRIAADGSIAGYAGETPLWGAAYVQECFIAADALLDDPGLLDVMRPALSRHVDWVLGFQQENGSWDTHVRGERERTNLIVNFLIWYHERIEPRPDVRAAIHRSIPSFTYDWWQDQHVYDAAAEVQRALSGIPLVALNLGRPVF